MAAIHERFGNATVRRSEPFQSLDVKDNEHTPCLDSRRQRTHSMNQAFLARLMGAAAVVTVVMTPLGANDALTGRWVHDASASDGNC